MMCVMGNGCYIMSCVFIVVSQLSQQAAILVSQGLRPSTRQTYSSAEKQYCRFYQNYGLCPIPATEETLLLFVTYLANFRGLKHGSIRVYLSATRSLHVHNGAAYPSPLHRLDLALKALANNGSPPSRKLPITYNVLEKMLHYCM